MKSSHYVSNSSFEESELDSNLTNKCSTNETPINLLDKNLMHFIRVIAPSISSINSQRLE